MEVVFVVLVVLVVVVVISVAEQPLRTPIKLRTFGYDVSVHHPIQTLREESSSV